MKVELKVIAGPHEGRKFQFDSHDTFFVGRGPQSHFRLPVKDNYFSRLHFMVEVNPPFCRLTDLESTNGTLVNRNRVQQVDLANGDVIRGGKTQLRVRIHTEDVRETRRQVVPVADPEDGEVTLPPMAHPVAAAGGTGQAIGPFQIVREIGRGGMGVVYLAQRPGEAEPVALKTIRPDIDISERDVRLFLREADVLKALQHPRIIRFVEIGEDNGQLYFATEYVPASDAGTLLREQGPLPRSVSIAIACQALEALEYAHELRYVHRDIKPQNILVAGPVDQPDVKLADFGLARVYETSRMSGITMQGEIGGSLAYAPPEYLTNYRDAAPAGDLYSVAATLYTLLTGDCIYDFPASMAQSVLMVMQTDPIPVREQHADVPDDLSAVIRQALDRDPAKRPQSAFEMRQSLLALL